MGSSQARDNANCEVVKSVGECDREHIEII